MQKQLWSPPILADQFELNHNLINMMTTDQFLRLEKDNPHDHIRWGSPPMARERTLAYKDLLRACPHHGFTELHQPDTFYNSLNLADQDSLNAAAGGNLLERCTQDVLKIIENKSTVQIAKLTHAVNQQTSDVTTAMTAILKQFQATLPPASVKAVEEICGQPVVGSKKKPSRSILTWEDLVSNSSMNSFPPQERQIFEMKFLTFNNGLMNRFMRHGIVTKISFVHALIMVLPNCTNFILYNALNPADQDSLNSAAGGNLLERRSQVVLTIIENKSKIAKITHAVNQQISAVTIAMTAILKQFQATPPPASVKAVEEICVTCSGAHPYY
nr:reverse transcriptase domain-containing protein [Tanacetum cinerariifolium]